MCIHATSVKAGGLRSLAQIYKIWNIVLGRARTEQLSNQLAYAVSARLSLSIASLLRGPDGAVQVGVEVVVFLGGNGGVLVRHFTTRKFLLICACAAIKVLILARLAHVVAQQVQGGLPDFDVGVLAEIVDHLFHTRRQ